MTAVLVALCFAMYVIGMIVGLSLCAMSAACDRHEAEAFERMQFRTPRNVAFRRRGAA